MSDSFVQRLRSDHGDRVLWVFCRRARPEIISAYPELEVVVLGIRTFAGARTKDEFGTAVLSKGGTTSSNPASSSRQSVSAVAPGGRKRKAPHFGGGLRMVGDVRRDGQATNWDSFAVSL